MYRPIARTTVTAQTGSHAEHDERTFRSLLELEHRRCLQSGHAFHVLLCRLSTQDGMRFPMNEPVKRALVSALKESLDETDQMGWFLQDLVLGALLVRDRRQSALSNGGGTHRIRRLIESRLSHAHPSVVLQFYDYMDLPPLNADAGDRLAVRPH